MPQLYGRSRLVRLAVRIADEFELHSPGTEEVDPSLPFGRSAACRRFTENCEAIREQVRDGRIYVIDVERNVMATDVAVARLLAVLVWCLKFKDLKVGAKVAAVKPEFFEDASSVNVEVFTEPVILANPRTELVDELASDDVHKKVVSLLNRRNGKADMFGASKAGDTHRCGCGFIIHVSIIPRIGHERKVNPEFSLANGYI